MIPIATLQFHPTTVYHTPRHLALNHKASSPARPCGCEAYSLRTELGKTLATVAHSQDAVLDRRESSHDALSETVRRSHVAIRLQPGRLSRRSESPWPLINRCFLQWREDSSGGCCDGAKLGATQAGVLDDSSWVLSVKTAYVSTLCPVALCPDVHTARF